MTFESTTQQQHQEEIDSAVTDLASTKSTYFPGTNRLKQKKNKGMQSTTSLATTNTEHFQNYEPVVSTGRKSWKHSLKKATSSVLYMAIPPSNAEQLPMVVPETPMSPDKLPSTPLVLRTPIVSRGPPSLAPSASTGSSRSAKSTKSIDQQNAGLSISQMPPMPTLDLSTLQRAHTSAGAMLKDKSHVNGRANDSEKERKSTSDQSSNSYSAVDKGGSNRRTKSFSAATLGSSSTGPAPKASDIPPVPAMISSRTRDTPSGSELRRSGTRSNRSSVDGKSQASSAVIRQQQAQQFPSPQHQAYLPLSQSPPSTPSMQHHKQQDSSDDDLELPSLPLPPTYTPAGSGDRMLLTPNLQSMLASSPPNEPHLPTLPLPPSSSNGDSAANLSRSNTTSTISSAIMTATRVTAVAATEIPIPPAQKPERPKLGGPQRSSPVLIKPLVLGESGDEKAFEELLRRVIIPNNRPTSLSGPFLQRPSITAVSPSAADHIISSSVTEEHLETDHSQVDSAAEEEEVDGHPVSTSLVGNEQDVEAIDESVTLRTDSAVVSENMQPSIVLPDSQGALADSQALPDISTDAPDQDDAVHEDNAEELEVVATEEQVIELDIREHIVPPAVVESNHVDAGQIAIEAEKLVDGEAGLTDAQPNFDVKLEDMNEVMHKQAEDGKEQNRSEAACVVPPAEIAVPTRERNKEIVVFGEDLFVEIAAPIWSGSEDELEPKSPELVPRTHRELAVPAVGAQEEAAVSSLVSESSSSNTSCALVSEPAVQELPVFVPVTPTFPSLAGSNQQKLTILPPGTKGAISLPIALPVHTAAIASAATNIPAATSSIEAILASPTKITFDQSPPRSPTFSASLLPKRSTSIISSSSSSSSALSTTSSLTHRAALVRRVTPRHERIKRQRSLKRKLIEARKARVSPWIWHHDGFRHHRLESHQILTKEQVFERFHLELDEEGSNGFFLFKLVRRYKDPLQEAAKQAVAAKSTSATNTSKEANSPKNKAGSTLESASFAQRLKRQLWIQKSKKEKKPTINNGGSSSNNVDGGSATEEQEEDIKTMLMMNNNASMSDLNSSLMDVMDAVDSLKRNSHLWVDDDSTFSMEPDGGAEEKTVYPQSDDEFAVKDKDHLVEHVLGLERRKGIYSTGRLDGMDLMPKKRFRALQRRASSSHRRASAAGGKSNNKIGTDMNGSSSSHGAGSITTVQSQFKKQAVMQLHIYSRNGLKFKFDVMENDELHFVEASKKYTFMDPLPANRQPSLPPILTEETTQEPENSVASLFKDDDNSLTRSLNSQRGIHPMYMTNKQLRTSTYNSNTSVATFVGAGISNGSSLGTGSSSSSSKRLSVASTLTTNSTVPSGKRVFVTRLGRHTLLTYHEYKDLAKSPGFLTLGAKLLIQRNMASLKGSSSSSPSSSTAIVSSPPALSVLDEIPLSPTFGSQNGPASGVPDTPASTTTQNSTSSVSSPPAATPSTEPTDYFNVKKKSIGLPSFGSKSKSSRSSSSSSSKSSLTAALNAAAGPATPSTPGSGGEKTSRAIVTPYNPKDYKTSTPLTVSSIKTTPSSADDASSDTEKVSSPKSPGACITSPIQIPLSTPPATPQQSQQNAISPSSPISPSFPDSAAVATLSTSGGGAIPINTNKKGNQAGLKFHHLFTMVHQRLCKLELEGGVPLLGAGLVQWAPIQDPAELRWWRDTVGISMIGWIEGDDLGDSELEEEEDGEETDDGYSPFVNRNVDFDAPVLSADDMGVVRSDDYDEDDEDDEFFDLDSQFDDDDERSIYQDPVEHIDERDDDEDIYDRSIGRSPPTNPSPLALRRSLSNSTNATFRTARSSRIRRVASPKPGGGGARRGIKAIKALSVSSSGSSSISPSSPSLSRPRSSSNTQPPLCSQKQQHRASPPRQRPNIMVERLGYRFVRVSGHMGVLKVTVSEKVEARAVALAIQAQAHVQHYHPLFPQCDPAVACPTWTEVDAGRGGGVGAGAAHGVAAGPWEEGVEAIGLEPGESLVERMSLIVAQSRAFKGNFYMKTIKMFNKTTPSTGRAA